MQTFALLLAAAIVKAAGPWEMAQAVAPVRSLEADAFLSQVQVKGSLFDDDSADWEAMNG